ncbi:MAG: 2-oxoglutarate dehydrogenase complex dihydrolipoyllysine-residue succinyltransferase [Cardiobacteriaceae bacterium]|nr:2-oxoglutarate dehydrogenase complex dihydrolipoyllysine-residue succinyltransferase [Cardiobacteriaceae bacterium]
MSTEVKVPDLPESVADATLVDWHFKVGDFVNAGDNLVDLETDKVVLEMPAPVSGVLKAILHEDGATVTSGTIVAHMEAGSAPAAAPAAETKAESAPAAAPAAAAASVAVDKNASPAARKMAAENDVKTADVAGSGRGGRVTKNDVKVHLSAGGSRHEERVPMTRMRKRIAERLIEAQQGAAMLTTFNEVNMKPVMDLRKKYQDLFVKKHDIKLGFMSFFVKAAIEALRKFPAVNASIDGDDIIYHNYYDIGIAVSGPRGLVVPILRNAEHMSLADIEKGIKDYADKTKAGTLALEDMTGGTFSITNGGTFGSMLSTPILNPPQSAILGMHNIVERPVVENGEIVIRPVMYLALTYDHRIIDGREAVSFLVAIKEALEDPARILLGV